ncbi:MAG TPA: right-handed parallel beta-helix repeat-containing protein [Solirubrobacterales bacterium]|nr:right-handed parallel beta-helix repeat-containing protein [Solirubrobacterales bacterium]
MAAALILLAVPALASAVEYQVDTLDNTDPTSGCEGGEDCALDGAIERANATPGPDAIKFLVAGKIKTGVNPLPPISERLTIDGTSAPGYAGNPVLELDGTESGSPSYGFEITAAAAKAAIGGFAINGFGTGIVIAGDEAVVCANYVGTNLAGTASDPNKRGIEVAITSTDTDIGAGCGEGNVLSGNEGFGMVDGGLGTAISNNLIGTAADGASPLGNGGLPLAGGVLINSVSGGALVGGPGGAGANTIAFNTGPGVLVEESGLTATIRGNAIYYNAGRGIEVTNADVQPPSLEEVEPGVGATSVTATMSGEPSQIYAIEFFASEQCDVTGFGEGQLLIGEDSVETDAGGTVQFEAPTLAALPAEMPVVTAVATDTEIASSSAFSNCRVERPAAPLLTSTAPGSGANDNAPLVIGSAPAGTTVSLYSQSGCGGSAFATVSPAQLAAGVAASVADNSVTEFSALVNRPYATTSGCSGSLAYQEVTPPAPPPIPATIQPIVTIPPVNGESVAVAPESGQVLVKRPGSNKFIPLVEGQTIPVGSVVDATNGKVLLTSVNAAGVAQSAVFYGGKFLVVQHDGSGLVILRLQGSLDCGARGSSVATASGKKGRRLWGSGKGTFRTEGNYGSASVRGTQWLTEDRCGSTYFKVKRGVVSVRDFPNKKTISLPAGKTYLAKP